MHLALADAVEPPVYPLQDKQACFLSLRECWLLTAHRRAPLWELPTLEEVVWPRNIPSLQKAHVKYVSKKYVTLPSFRKSLKGPPSSRSLCEFD